MTRAATSSAIAAKARIVPVKMSAPDVSDATLRAAASSFVSTSYSSGATEASADRTDSRSPRGPSTARAP
jgi:hypothetical protein